MGRGTKTVRNISQYTRVIRIFYDGAGLDLAACEGAQVVSLFIALAAFHSQNVQSINVSLAFP